MSRAGRIIRTLGWGIVLLFFAIEPIASPQVPVRTQPASTGLLAHLPQWFEANRGQTDGRVKFLSRGPGYTLFLAADEAVLVLSTGQGAQAAVLRMRPADAAPAPEVEGLEELAARSNYFIGSDPGRWRTGVPAYAKVRYRGVYPGIDLLYYGSQRQLEYDFVVAPGADPGAIAVAFEGADSLAIDGRGELVVAIPGGEVRLRRPTIHQEAGGVRREIAGGYVLKGPSTVGFHVAAYDASLPLVIDPVLSYGTYLGGSGIDQGLAVALDSAGDIYVAGVTSSTDFPVASGAVQTGFGGLQDAFVARLNPSGAALVYSTYLGGTAADLALGITVDAAGDAYLTGTTASSAFPTTFGAFRTTFGGTQDGFVAKIGPTGALVYSTFLGGIGADGGRSIAVDAAGDAFVVGFTNSINFPTTDGALQTTYGGVQDAFVTKLNAQGTALFYSTYLGGGGADSGWDIALGGDGSAYITGNAGAGFPITSGAAQTVFGGGSDAFVTQLNAQGNALVYSSYLGGSASDQSVSIALDTGGDAFVTGTTFSSNFPTTSGAVQTVFGGSQDAFVVRLNAGGTARVYSTYLGGSGIDNAHALAVDADGDTYVVGVTTSVNFSIAGSAPQVAINGPSDAFVTRLNTAGAARVFSTYLGGSATETARGVALSPAGDVAVVGFTASTDFPISADAIQSTSGGSQDVFVVWLSQIVATTTTLTASANPSVVGQGVTFTAAVTPSAATGTVTFRDGTTLLATVALASGPASFSTSQLALGTHPITAAYSGSAGFSPSSASLTQQVISGICVLYDQTRSVKSGAVFPIKVSLCDASGVNLSSPTIVLHAVSVVLVSGYFNEPEDAGNANPDNDFRFDSVLGGYIFNLSTRGLAGGTYSLQFTVTGDPVVHGVLFGVR